MSEDTLPPAEQIQADEISAADATVDAPTPAETHAPPPMSIEDALAQLCDSDALAYEPPVVPAPPRPEPQPPTRFRVFIPGPAGDLYLSNGDLSANIPRNKDVVVSAALMQALKNTEGVPFTAVPEA